MGKLTITIETGNAAFEGRWELEAARILKSLGVRLSQYGYDHTLPIYDGNGSRVGQAVYEETSK